MPDLSRYFLPYQRRWINSTAALVIGEKSRRIGWTYASSFRAVDRRLRLGTNLYFSSADLSAAREFVEYCLTWARVANAAADDLGLCALDEADGLTAFVLRFENGARIVAGSSNPKFFRSKGGDADADEYAFHADQRSLFRAMHATAMVWGHQLRLWSTHHGEHSFFNQMIRQGKAWMNERAAGGTARFAGLKAEVQTVTIYDAVNDGLVEKIKSLSMPSEAARRDWLDELRSTVPDDATWRQEYLCEPGGEDDALLSDDLITGCESTELGESPAEWWADPLNDRLAPAGANGPLYAGFDVGRKHDRSVLWVLEKVGDVYWTRGLRRLDQMPFTQQENLLHMLLCIRRVKRLCVDSTGIGAMLAERLVQRWGGRVEAVHFTAQVKNDLAMPLVRLFQDKCVRVPADAAVREDLHSVKRTITAARNIRYDAERTNEGHGDHFWSLALAYHAASDTKRPLPQSLLAKPIGW